MGSAVNNVLAGGEEDENPIPGSQDDTSLDSGPGGAVGPAGGAGAPISTPPIAPAPSPVQIDSSQKVHPHMAILAGLLKGILGGIQNAPGNPRNAFDRGFMNASPNQQAMQSATLSQAKSQADLAKIQTSRAQLDLILTKHMVDRLDQADQEKFIKSSDDYYRQVVEREGLEVDVTGDPKGADGQAKFKNNTDPNVKSGLGTWVPMYHFDPKGDVKASVVFFPRNSVLQEDVDLGPNPNFDSDQPESDSNPKELIIPKGTPQKGLPQVATAMRTLAQGATKDQHGELARLNKLPEDNPNQIQAKHDQLQQWLNDKSNDSVFKRHNQADVQATINRLGPALKSAEQRKISEAKAMATQVTIPTAEAREAIKHDFDPVYARDESGNLVATNRKTATAQGYSDIDDTITKADVTTDRKTAPIIKDVRGKLQDYQAEIKKGDLSALENARLAEITGLSDADFDAKIHGGLMARGVGIGGSFGIGPTMKGLQQMFKNIDMSRLSDKAEKRLVTYIAARSSALELQKAQTQSSRASKEGLTLDLSQIPHPGLEGRTANDQLDLLLKSVDRISAENPFAEDKTAKFLRKLAGRPSSE